MKELFIEAHEELVAEYMEAHPNASELEAYDATEYAVQSRYQDKLGDMIDAAHDRAKYGE